MLNLCRRTRLSVCGTLLSALTLLGACGARTEILLGHEVSVSQGSAGGTGGDGGTGGSGGTGGAGGGPIDPEPLCALTRSLPVLSVGGGAFFHQRQPDLVITGDDPSRVTLAAEWRSTQASPSTASELRHTTFFPWVEWPEGGQIAPSYLAHLSGGGSFAADHAEGNPLSLAMIVSPGTALFSPEFTPGSGNMPSFFTLSYPADRILFNLAGDSTNLLGMQWQVENSNPPVYRQVYEVLSSPTFEGGCASAPGAADAIHIAGGWLVAHVLSATEDLSQPCMPGNQVRPPTMLQTQWHREDDPSDSFIAVPFDDPLHSGKPIQRIQVTPRPEGAWLLWSYGSTGMSPLSAIRLTERGDTTGGIASLFAPDTPGAFAAAALGTSLAVASVLGGTRITIMLLDRDVQLESLVEIDADFPVVGAPSLIGWPDGRGLVLAWSESPPDGSGDRIRLARFECASGG
ncbi:hypothetical protein [Chondromyces apiculatus]|uniref:Lipoprotein n=1 Tax=Chondromyces apiculatus DSM 436 TaxID=1192034 RepID=A0A017T078_9BACT|nr:hypothetical protein [Chondromyces apiculatus]EYF02265.1 Hypothetical protein CAP_7337 [Chondromyces apiculatus DSM 436]